MMQRGSSSVQCVVRNSCGFGVLFFFPSQTGSLMPLGDPQTPETQFLKYTGL